jgi:anti-sigma regulatory factor (Ser/Thr protein kinase)
MSRQVVSPTLDAGLAARRARESAGQILRGWGLPAMTDDAAVIVSELVTNALRHGCADLDAMASDQVEVILWRRAGQVVCAVIDSGAEAPVMASPDPLSEAGRGLLVIQALSANWGWTRLGGRRKAVWAALSVPSEDGAAQDGAAQDRAAGNSAADNRAADNRAADNMGAESVEARTA